MSSAVGIVVTSPRRYYDDIVVVCTVVPGHECRVVVARMFDTLRSLLATMHNLPWGLSDSEGELLLAAIAIAENGLLVWLTAWHQRRQHRKQQEGRQHEAVRVLVTAVGSLLPNLRELELGLRRMDGSADAAWFYFTSDSWSLDRRQVERLAAAVTGVAMLSQDLSMAAAAASDAVAGIAQQYQDLRFQSALPDGKEIVRQRSPAYRSSLIQANNLCNSTLAAARVHAPSDSKQVIDRLLG